MTIAIGHALAKFSSNTAILMMIEPLGVTRRATYIKMCTIYFSHDAAAAARLGSSHKDYFRRLRSFIKYLYVSIVARFLYRYSPIRAFDVGAVSFAFSATSRRCRSHTLVIISRISSIDVSPFRPPPLIFILMPPAFLKHASAQRRRRARLISAEGLVSFRFAIYFIFMRDDVSRAVRRLGYITGSRPRAADAAMLSHGPYLRHDGLLVIRFRFRLLSTLPAWPPI